MFLDMRIEFFLYMYQKKSNEQVSNVLLIKKENNNSYYVFIKDLNRLMDSQIKTKNVHKNISVCHVYKVLLLKKY